MEMFYNHLKILFIVSLICMCSCSKQEHTSESDTEVEVNLALSTNMSTISTKAFTSMGEDINEYSVLITKDGSPYAGFDNYSDIPNGKIKLKYGNYHLKAYWGYQYDGRFDAPYVVGEQDFSLTAGAASVDIPVVCKIANVVATVEYSDDFKGLFSSYKEYFTEIYTSTSKPLLYGKDEVRKGFFNVSDKLYVRLKLKDMAGKEYIYGIKSFSDIKAAEHYAIKLDANSTTGSITAIIKVVDDLNEVIYEETVVNNGLVESAPTISLSFGKQLYIDKEDDSPNNKLYIANIWSAAGVKDIVIDHDCKYLLSKGIPAKISYLELENNLELKYKLDLLGVKFNVLKLGAGTSTVDFTDLFNTISKSISLFNIEVKNYQDKTVSTWFKVEVNK